MGNVKRIPARAQVSKDGLAKDGWRIVVSFFPGNGTRDGLPVTRQLRPQAQDAYGEQARPLIIPPTHHQRHDWIA